MSSQSDCCPGPIITCNRIRSHRGNLKVKKNTYLYTFDDFSHQKTKRQTCQVEVNSDFKHTHSSIKPQSYPIPRLFFNQDDRAACTPRRSYTRNGAVSVLESVHLRRSHHIQEQHVESIFQSPLRKTGNGQISPVVCSTIR